jgi:starch-binding outer membrane protein, SusD/RagB family
MISWPMLVLAGTVFGVAACTDLSEDPLTEVTDAHFNPTEDELGNLMAPVYTPLQSLWKGWHGNLDMQEETADVLLTPVRPNGWDDGGIYIRLHEHRWDAGQPQPAGLWSDAFSGITAINRVEHQIETDFVELDEDVATSVLAELKALRAYYYYVLLDSFGRVPIVDDFTSEELPAQATREEVFDYVVDALNTAIPELSEAADASVYGRINAWAARAILARVYLNAEVYTGTPRYGEVIELTQEIMDAGVYSLEDTYTAPFARDNEHSLEVIWAVPYDEINAGGSNFHMKTLKPELQHVFNMQSQPWGGSASNPQFIDTYDEDDTRLHDTWLIGPQFDAQGRGYDFVQHVPSITSTRFEHGYPVWKYEIYSGMTGGSDVDYPIVRYAEVLMMKAEALLRLGDANGGAQIVTEIRQRAFRDTDPSKATVTGAQLLEGSSYNYGWYDRDGVVKTGPGGTPVENGGADIQYGRFLDELGWEFAVEGHRRQHLIRFGVFTTKTWFNHTPQGDHVTVFPIPEGALDTNSNLTQNPGY